MIYDLFTMSFIWWEWEKKPRNAIRRKKKTKENFPVWLLSHPRVYEMVADCFPVSENTENKPDLPLGGKGIPA